MNNKKNAVILAVFIISLLFIIGLIAIAGHIPFIGKALTLIISIILTVFVIGFFVMIIRRNKK